MTPDHCRRARSETQRLIERQQGCVADHVYHVEVAKPVDNASHELRPHSPVSVGRKDLKKRNIGGEHSIRYRRDESHDGIGLSVDGQHDRVASMEQLEVRLRRGMIPPTLEEAAQLMWLDAVSAIVVSNHLCPDDIRC
jgi:hypothetical protein